jgi:hypothetical protein
MIAPAPSFEHLLRLSDSAGTFEHAKLSTPRIELGYCTDDMARVLVVASREPIHTAAVDRLTTLAIRFLSGAQGVTGECRNRRNIRGRWTGRRTVEDCWGRSVWGLGTAAGRSQRDSLRQDALAYFDHGVRRRSPWPRAMAFAALGAAEVVCALPDHRLARELLGDAVDTIRRPAHSAAWPWPEPRLSYANAVLPEALIAAGAVLGQRDLLDEGLALLRWLLDHETDRGHLSLTPVGGAGANDQRPRFDQQPIEAAALADACARAAEVTGDEEWLDGLRSAVGWFLGDNDVGVAMWDPATGGGFDGLTIQGPNLNQGAESTLALISTLQHARRCFPTPV